MPTINTQDLTGPALDWAVAHAEGLTTPGRFLYVRSAMRRATLDTAERLRDMEAIDGASVIYSPSTNPAQGHPIIERECIWLGPAKYMAPSVTPLPGREWMAKSTALAPHAPTFGPTALIAAMRCWAAFRLGQVVDVPAELLP